VIAVQARINELARAKEIAMLVAELKGYRASARSRRWSIGDAPSPCECRPRPALQWGDGQRHRRQRCVVGEPGAVDLGLSLTTPCRVGLHPPPEDALRPVVIAQYREDGVVIDPGCPPAKVVATGANKLHEGQAVRPYEASGRPSPPVAASSS
jgi:hypothetical protein